MANQIIVTSNNTVQVSVTPTPTVQVEISRAAIGNISNVANANYANFAGNIVGNLGNLSVTGTTTTGNLVVLGNLQVGNLVANTANYANFAGNAFSVAGANVTGTVANATYAANAGNSNIANTAYSVSAANVSGLGNIATINLDGNVANVLKGDGTFGAEGTTGNANYANFAGTAFSVSGSNVSGAVANATYAANAGYADNSGNANIANTATIANTANIANTAYSVSVGNVSGIGNIATVNLDGNSSNVLKGDGTFGPEGSTGNANYANFAGTAYSVSGSNVSGAVANATYADDAGNANIANTAYAVSGANVSGAVANATYANDAGNANIANNVTILQDFGNTSAQYVTYVGANTSGNQKVKVDLSFAYFPNNNILQTNGGFYGKLVGANSLNPNSFVTVTSANGNITSNVNGATKLVVSSNGIDVNGNITSNAGIFTGNASGLTDIPGANVSGIVANATYALDAGNSNYANTANVANIAYSVDGANVSGIVANATYALDAGNSNYANTANVANIAYSIDGANVSGTVANATYALDAGNANIANTAYSVDVANVSGIGNIATINLDGNVANALLGDGTFGPVELSTANTVTDNAQPNITSVGNLVSLTVDANIANTTTVQIDGNLITHANANAYSIIQAYDAGSGLDGQATEIKVINNINDEQLFETKFYGDNALASKISTSIIGPVGNSGTDPYIDGAITFTSYSGDGNLANINTQTMTTFAVNGGSLFTNIGAPADQPALGFQVYGNVFNGAGQQGFRFRRRRGNNDARTGVVASDYLGNIEWQGASTSTGGYNANATIAKIAPKVESTYGGAGTGPIPTGIDFIVSNGTNTTHSFNSNGTVTLGTLTKLAANTTTNIDLSTTNSSAYFSVTENANLSTASQFRHLNTVQQNYVQAGASAGGFAVFMSNTASGNVIPGNIKSFWQFTTTGNLQHTLGGSGAIYAKEGQFGSGSVVAGSFTGNTLNLGSGAIIGNGTARQFTLVGDSTPTSSFSLTNAQFSSTLTNINVASGFSAFRFNVYDSNATISPLRYYRARGTQGTPLATTTNDIIAQDNYATYSDSGNTYVNLFNVDVKIDQNYGNGNVSASYDIKPFNSQSNINIGVSGGFPAKNINLVGNVTTPYTVSIASGNISLNANGRIDYLRTFGSFTSNATQTSNGANTTNYMTFNNTEDANGVSIVSSSQLTVARTGLYNIQFSAQLNHDTNQTANIEIWLTKNGSAVANTNSRIVLVKDQPMIAAWNYVDNATTANTYYQLAWASPDTNVELVAFDTANTISGVAIPSVIATITPVGA